MVLINTAEHFQKTGITDFNFSPTVFKPYVENAQEQYLVKVLGEELLDELITQYEATALTAENQKLWLKAIKVVGPLAKYLMTPESADKISNLGVTVSQSDNNIPSSDIGIYHLRTSLLNSGYNAIDTLYKFLYKNKTDYPLWTASDAFIDFKKHFISTAEQFNLYVVINQSSWIFYQLSAYMNDVESRYIMSAISEELFDDLKEKWADESFSTEEKKLHKLLCQCIAQYTYALGLKSPFVRQEIQNVIAARSAGYSTKSFSKEDYAQIINEHEALAKATLNDAVAYLNKTASDTVFPLWFTGTLYKSPVDKATERGSGKYHNSTSNSSFVAL